MNRKPVTAALMSLFLLSLPLAMSYAQGKTSLPVKYEELTAPELVEAVELSDGICLIPLGILEKHGPHLPLGTDLLDVRERALRAAKMEYSVIFPEFYFGQIYEAKHQPGTIAYSPDLVWEVLEETCDELARNGFKKIVLVNGHGGNNSFLPYFCQAQLAEDKDYAVVLFSPGYDSTTAQKVEALRKTTTGGHAGETETSMILAHRPDLAHVERGADQSGENLERLEHLRHGYTAIWWYAQFPNHYAGDGSEANREIGELLLNGQATQLAELIRILKKDKTIMKLQREFFDKSENPLKTRQ
ncbi:MAG: creatininase family protein [Fidelibacterota bacterium]|nr:MAG: creatininase family protein [Candidatus Neomarinimicrobiota bacterium]